MAKERKFQGYLITDELPKKGDLLICIQKKNFNYGQTIINSFEDPGLTDTKNWKKTVRPLMGFERYPEFKKLVNKLADEACVKINAEAPKIKSKMPYKPQFTLEMLIQILQERV